MSARKKKAGHRSWAAKGQRIPGRHRGDIMSAATRSALMSRIHGKGTAIERCVELALTGEGIRFESHAKDLPGRPDVVMRSRRLAVFVDGDFWHGFRLPLWRHKLSPKWRDKIEANVRRDRRNFARLRRQGWTVVRIWEHQVERDADACIAKVKVALKKCKER